MRDIVTSIEGEYQRYVKLGEGAIEQTTDEELTRPLVEGGNSIATLVWHLGGNLRSRFTDFLTSDGEKPWRERDAEFQARDVTRDELMGKWGEGWSALFGALAQLDDDSLPSMVIIRGQPLTVTEALHRSLAHASYHVGQIVMLGRTFRGAGWHFMSIPPGGSAAYNLAPGREKPPGR